ncbi:MAG: alpha/beta fold hydrolase [Saprospiraceae bacterium]|nr:alpha/beta fold hydrolase [Saprospiraceae bacterium]
MKKTYLILFGLLSSMILFGQQFPDSRVDGKYYTINGAKIWTVSHGEGDPLFVIPGGPGSAHVGMRRLDSLATSCKLVYFDGFGRGLSDTALDVRDYNLDRDVADLEALRVAMNFSAINIFGHSYGTVVAQAYALKFPERVKHLILSAPFHSHAMWQENDDNCNHEIRVNYPEVWDTLKVLRKQGFKSSDPIHQEVYGRVPYGFLYAYNPENFKSRGQNPYPNRFNAKLYYQMVGKDGDFKVGSDIGRFDFRKKLKDLKMPVLILAGRFDRVAVPWLMVQYKTYCPQAAFYLFEKSGHNTFVEEPEKTFSIIRNFLKP